MLGLRALRRSPCRTLAQAESVALQLADWEDQCGGAQLCQQQWTHTAAGGCAAAAAGAGGLPRSPWDQLAPTGQYGSFGSRALHSAAQQQQREQAAAGAPPPWEQEQGGRAAPSSASSSAPTSTSAALPAPASWVDRLPESWIPYAHLMRLEKPIGERSERGAPSRLCCCRLARGMHQAAVLR